MKQIGNRMKENYEHRSRLYLTRRVPVILRIDGVAFHTFTKGFQAFDPLLMDSMVNSVKSFCKRMQGFKCAYIQSDEVSILLTDYDKLETCAWFDYNKSKLESVSASLMTAYFQNDKFKEKTNVVPYFDCRAFNIPKEEVVNYFLWRALDWQRNSLHMYCSQFYSQKDLFRKNTSKKHEMLYNIGKNWAKDLTDRERNGTFLLLNEELSEVYIKPKYEDINSCIGEYVNV